MWTDRTLTVAALPPIPGRGRQGAAAPARRRRRGSALLAVLWLSAALAAIAFSLSSTVRGETDRASTSSDGLRAYHVASGAVQAAALNLLWNFDKPRAELPRVLEFPEGVAFVEYLPETGKLDINSERGESLYRLLQALGAPPERASEIAAAIEDWRTLVPEGSFSRFDEFYLSQNPSFRANHSSFQETEELLLVKGVTPDLYYGTWTPVPDAPAGQPRLAARSGLRDCLSVFGSRAVDVNSARPEVLLAIGVAPDVVSGVMARRRIGPIDDQTLGRIREASGQASARLRIGGGTIWTIRATAQLRLPGGALSDLKRTVAGLFKYMPAGYDAPMHVLRWYDTAWSN